MIIKSAQADGFNLTTANSVSSSNYTAVAKTGGNITKSLASSAKDVYGEVLREGVSYRAFVLSVTSNGNMINNALSQNSSSIILSKNVTTPSVTNVKAIDVGDFGDGRDVRVSFNSAANEAGISSYVVMVVRAADVSTFNIDVANGVPSTNYTMIPKGDAIRITTLPSTAKDTRGSLISSGVPYRVFVLSIADGSTATGNALSIASNELTLVTKTLSWAGQFRETTNDGSVDTTVTATLIGSTFTNSIEVGNELQLNTHYSVSNVPTGLTVKIIKSSVDGVTIYLEGTAMNHEAEHSISNLGISFTTAAFTNAEATSITGYSKNDLEVLFGD
jgi:hypothetical protein